MKTKEMVNILRGLEDLSGTERESMTEIINKLREIECSERGLPVPYQIEKGSNVWEVITSELTAGIVHTDNGYAISLYHNCGKVAYAYCDKIKFEDTMTQDYSIDTGVGFNILKYIRRKKSGKKKGEPQSKEDD